MKKLFFTVISFAFLCLSCKENKNPYVNGNTIIYDVEDVGDAQAEYILQTVGILLTVCLIPLSLRMFSLSLTRYVRQLSLPEALVSYRRWCEIRLAMLLAPALFNLTVYYTTLDVTSLLCMGMLLVASLFCVPGRGRLMRELDLQKDEPEK